jgi:hypothetical protein
MSKKKEESCVDCLHCKVSAKSTKNNRLCFCSEAKNKRNHKELYWIKKETCKNFESMD